MKNPFQYILVKIIGYVLAFIWIRRYRKRAKESDGWFPKYEQEYKDVVILSKVPPWVDYTDACRVGIDAGMIFATVGAGTYEGRKAQNKQHIVNISAKKESATVFIGEKKEADRVYAYIRRLQGAQTSEVKKPGYFYDIMLDKYVLKHDNKRELQAAMQRQAAERQAASQQSHLSGLGGQAMLGQQLSGLGLR
jgi:hypothetical protein